MYMYMYIPNKSAIVLSEVEVAFEAQVIQCLAEGLDGSFSKWLQRLVQNGCILSL